MIKCLVIILICIFIIIFSISSYNLLIDFKDYKGNNELNQNLIQETIKINEDTKEKIIDWDYLKSINEDIIGWIEIEGTNINYPILKDNKQYYLKHSFNKKYNNAGSIFTTNVNPFVDKETVIYGHNMRNETMFSELSKYLDKDFLDSHNTLKIYTPSAIYEGRIFSVYSIGIETENDNIKQLNYDERIVYYKNASKYKIDSVDDISKIVKLSTCSYINTKTRITDQRYYIIASINQI